MNKYAFNTITLMQFIFLNTGVQVSVGVLALPQVLAVKAGTDGWIGLILCWALAAAASLIVIRVMQKRPDSTLLDLFVQYGGEWAGRAAAVFFALYYAYYAYIEIVRMLLYTKQWLLPQTTPWLVMLLMLIPTYTVARGGLRILGRYIELIFFLSLMVPLPYLYTLQDAHWLHLLPVVKDGWQPILSAFRESLLYYTGFGVSLMLYPFLEHKDKASAGIVISSTLSMLAYLFIVIVCFVYFSPDEMKLYNDPVINILKTIQFKFIERFEVLMTSFFLFLFSTSWITTLYLCAFCTSWLFQRQDHRPHLRLLCLIVGIGTYFYMPTFNESGRIVQFFGRIAIGVEYVLPVCLLLYMAAYDRLRRRRIE